jgi:hypothetical protein
MAFIKFEVPNSLPKEEAAKRVQALLDYWNRTYGVKSSWTDDGATMNGKAMGVTIDGRLQVLTDKISGEATDPGMLLRGQAKKYLTKKFSEYLDPAKSLADLLKLID